MALPAAVTVLEDIEYYAAAAVRFITGFSVEQYLADDKTRAAVEARSDRVG